MIRREITGGGIITIQINRMKVTELEKVIIIGAGPAGISAALYAARGNMAPLVINNGIGALEKAEKIENYYGLASPV